MKGYMKTGKGTARSGHHFPKKAGFTSSSGRVQHVSGYTRSVPKARGKGAGLIKR